MKRITIVTVLLACGFLAAGTPLFAQTAAPDTAGELVHRQGQPAPARPRRRRLVEVRGVPRRPEGHLDARVLTLQGSYNGNDFALFGEKISQTDQRYSGYANVALVRRGRSTTTRFRTTWATTGRRSSPRPSAGVWSMNATLRKALGDAVDAVPTAARTYPFYADLLAPTHRVGQQHRPHQPAQARRRTRSTSARSCRSTCRSPTCARRRRGTAAPAAATSSASSRPPWTWREPLNEVDAGLSAIRCGLQLQGRQRVRHVQPQRLQQPGRRARHRQPVPGDRPGRTRRPPSPAARHRRASARRPTTRPTAARSAPCSSSRSRRGSRPTSRSASGRRTRRSCPYTINSAIFSTTGAPANSVSHAPAAVAQREDQHDVGELRVLVASDSRPRDPGALSQLRSHGQDEPVGDHRRRVRLARPDLGRGDARPRMRRTGTRRPIPTNTRPRRFDAQVSYDIRDLTLEGVCARRGARADLP